MFLVRSIVRIEIPVIKTFGLVVGISKGRKQLKMKIE